MKKVSILIVITFLMLTTYSMTNISLQAAESIEVEAESAIIVDAKTGKILFEKQSDLNLPPYD